MATEPGRGHGFRQRWKNMTGEFWFRPEQNFQPQPVTDNSRRCNNNFPTHTSSPIRIEPRSE